jgi:hypothetical protein
MEPYILFFYTFLFVISILPVFIVSLLIRKKIEIRNTKKITTICVVIQLVSYVGLIGLMDYLLKGDTSGGMIGVVVIPALVAINALIGLISYPLVYMFVLRRAGWIKPFSVLLGSYVFILSALLGKPLIQMLEEVFNREIISEENINFYGKLVDANLMPVQGAVAHLRNCEWYSNNPSITDSNGIFHIRGHCKPSRSLLIDSIFSTDGFPCYLQFGDEEYDITHNKRNYVSVARDNQDLVVGIRHSSKDVSYKKMLWDENSASSPVQFDCNFVEW